MRRSIVAICLVVSVVPAVGGTAAGGADSCSLRDARRLITTTFVKAYNAGTLKTLDRIFAKGEEFEPYRVQPIERALGADEDRTTLLEYFAERHRYRDELSIDDLVISKYRNRPGFGFGFVLTRTSDQLMPFADGTFSGKGSVRDCEITTWNMSWQGP